MSWSEIKTAYHKLAEANESSAALARPWSRFAKLVRATEGRPPSHLVPILAVLDQARAGAGRGDLSFLDHGCGGGVTLLYLLALGYEGIHGVDMEGATCERWNRLLRDRFGIDEPRFRVYGGAVLPFADDAFDVVFSQQVLEHVRPDVLHDYYREEHRVLRPGGYAYHQVPHRLVPYESHTRKWLLHYLPRRTWLALLRRSGQDMTTAETALFLRWPWAHRRLVRAHLGDCRDLTLDRIMGPIDLENYDGPRGLRGLLVQVLRIPILGRLCGRAVRNFVMLDTVSRNRG